MHEARVLDGLHIAAEYDAAMLVRYAAVRTLGRIGHPDSARVYVRIATEEPEASVRHYAHVGLAAIVGL